MGDPATLTCLIDAVQHARDAAVEEAAADTGDTVGEHLEARPEDDGAVTHFFAARHAGYRGWRWSVTLACAGDDSPVTVSEVVLLPGGDALVSPAWVPWQERVRPGDLGVGDLLPTTTDDPRLAPAYLASDDPAVEDVAWELGLGRKTVLLVDNVEDFRLPSVTSLDARIEKKFTFGKAAVALDFDIFNVLNSGTVLGNQYDSRLTGPTGFGQVLEIMNPRIARLGARFFF